MSLPLTKLENITLIIITTPPLPSFLYGNIPTISSTSGRLHSEFVLLLFLQVHRETDLFFATSGVHLA